MPKPAAQSDQPAAVLASTSTPARRVGVLVLGMHRSGTSAITRMLALLGCTLPSTLMSAAFHNPRGHWESQRVADFNDEILALAGTQWNDWLPVNGRLAETLVWPQLVEKGRQVLREEFADAPLFVLKDPRICKLAGFWMEVLAAEGVDPVFVLPIRNPIEVAQSLATRDAIDEAHGLLFWLRYVLAAEAATRGCLRVFTDYATLLTKPEVMASRLSADLGVVWPRVSALSAAEISEFLTPDLRHHVSDMAELGEHPAISPWLRQAYEVLLDWARHGEKSADYPILDGISRAFDDASAAFARPMLQGELAVQRVVQAEAGHAAVVAERDEVSRRLGEVEAELARMIGSHGNLAEARDTTARRLGEVEAEIAQACAERDARVADRDHLAAELAALTQERDALGSRLGQVEAELHQACAERDAQTAARDRLVGEQALLAEERDAVSQRLGEVEAEFARMIGSHNNLAEERDTIARRLGEVEAEFAQACADRDARTAERDELVGERAALAEERHRNYALGLELAALQNRLADQDSALRQKQEEAAQAWAELAAERLTAAGLNERNDRLEQQAEALTRSLQVSEGWVFQLAGARRQAEQQERRLTGEVQRLTGQLRSLKREAAELQQALAAEKSLRQDPVDGAKEEAQRLRDALAEQEAAALGLRDALTEQAAANTARTGRMERELVEAQAARRMAEDQAARAASLKVDLEHKLAERFAESAELAKLLRDRDGVLNAAQTELAETKGRLADRFGEIATLTRLFREQEQQTTKRRKQADWLRQVYAAMAASPRWWAIMPASWRHPREMRRLQRKGLFDADAYLARYPDVAAQGMSPLRHYILHGMVEGRSI